MTGNRPLPTVPAGVTLARTALWLGQPGLAWALCEKHRVPQGRLLVAQVQAASSPGAGFSITDLGGGWHSGRGLQGAQRKGRPH